MVYILGTGFLAKNIYLYLSLFFNCKLIGRRAIDLPCKVDQIFLRPYEDKFFIQDGTFIHLIDNFENINQEWELVKKISNNVHVILFSSSVIYTKQETEYKKRKIFLENLYSQHFKKLTTLRLFNTYGPYQQPFKQGSFIANVFYSLIHKKTLKITNLAVKRDFMFVKDLAKIVYYLVTNKSYGNFDVCTGTLLSLQEVISKITHITGKNLNISMSGEDSVEVPQGNPYLFQFIKPTDGVENLKSTYHFYKTFMKA